MKPLKSHTRLVLRHISRFKTHSNLQALESILILIQLHISQIVCPFCFYERNSLTDNAELYSDPEHTLLFV